MKKKEKLLQWGIKSYPRPFFQVAPNKSWSLKKNGDIDKFRPILVRNRLDDIGVKIGLVGLSYHSILLIIEKVESNIVEKEDCHSLTFGPEYLELQLFVNHLLFEACAILCLFARITSYLFPTTGKLTRAGGLLNEDIIKKVEDKDYKNFLRYLKNESWVNYLTNVKDGIDGSALRVLGIHFTQIKIIPHLDPETFKLKLYLVASKNVDDYFPLKGRHDLLEVMTSIKYGLDNFTNKLSTLFKEKNRFE